MHLIVSIMTILVVRFLTFWIYSNISEAEVIKEKLTPAPEKKGRSY